LGGKKGSRPKSGLRFSFGPIPCMPLKNILIPCMPLAPHVIDTKKYTYMPLSGTQGMSIKSDGIPGIFSTCIWSVGIFSRRRKIRL
jgi:hypothetical protein